MIDRQQIQDRQPRGECPSDAALGMFDSGTLSSSEAERISDHVVNCKRCRGPFKDQHREETRLLAEIFTPGRALLAEPEFEQARRTLLERPEPVCAAQVEEAETSLSPRGLPRHDHVPSEVGPYRLRYELGRGAMGIVYRARHANLKRDASLKILHPQLVEDHEMVERFYGEMEAFGQLRDPHIVQAYDAGESAGVHFLAMEYVDGADASKLCAYAGRLNTPDACQIVRQAALGLETARRHNMVHRDIKPSNLMVARNGQVKILDLGLASFRKEGVESFHEDAVGTVDYMAPEQWKGSSRIDIRADIYSLGCTLFKLLTGHPPFYDAPDDGVSKMQAHLTQAAPTLREIRRELPRELETLVNRMLAKRASDRLSSPQEIAALLEPFCVDSDLAGLVERHVPADTLAPSGSVEPSDTMATGKSKTFAERKRRRWTRWAVCAAVVGVLAILATVVVRITGEGTVVVAVNQPGATIQIGSELISTDKAGQSVLVNIGRGQHTVKVTKEGFETRVEIVEVRPNRETSIDITLTPQQITAQRPRTLVGHKGPVHAVDISPDGKWVLTGGKDRSVRLWSVASGNEQLQMLGHEDVVWDVAFGPESKYAVSCSLDKTARMWDLKTGEEFQRFNGHKDAVLCVALSGEGTQLLTGSKDGTVRTWDTTTGQPQGIMTGHRGWVRAVTFLPDSRYAVSCGHDLVAILWDLETGSMRKVLQGHTRPLSGISASVDGQHVVTCSWDSTVRLWNVHTEQELNVMRLHGGPVRSVTFLATNNHVISASEDYDLRLWNPFSGECVREYNGHSGKVFDVAVNSTAGLVVSASADCTARIWKLPELEDKPGVDALSQRPPEPLIGETAVAVKPIRKWEASEQALQSVAIISDGKLVASGGDDGVVRVWETDSGKLQRELTDATDSNLCVRFSPNGHLLAAGGKDHRIYLWNMSEESPAKTLVGHKGWVTGIAFLSNSQRLLSGSFDTTSRIWDVKKAKPLLAFPGRIQWIRSVDVGQNPQGALRILGGNAGCLQIWTVANGRAMGRLLGVPYQSPAIACIAISPNGRLVADAGWSHGVRIRNMMKGQLVNQFDCHGGTVYDVLWYGDNRRILTACADGTLRLWDRRSRRELKRYVGHVGAVRSVSLSADAKLIVSAGEDGMVCVWPAEGIASPLGRPNNKPVASQGATQK